MSTHAQHHRRSTGTDTVTPLQTPVLDRYARTLGRGHPLWARIGCDYPWAVWLPVTLVFAFVVVPALGLAYSLDLVGSLFAALSLSAVLVFGGVFTIRSLVYWLVLRPTLTTLAQLSDTQRQALVRVGQDQVDRACNQMRASNPDARQQWLGAYLNKQFRNGACAMFEPDPQRQLDALVYLRAPASSRTRTLAYDIQQMPARARPIQRPGVDNYTPESLYRLERALARR